MQLTTHNHPQVYKTESPYKENGSACREVELSCGCKMPIVAGEMSPEGQHKLEHWRYPGDTMLCWQSERS